jgi:hypothetical protein
VAASQWARKSKLRVRCRSTGALYWYTVSGYTLGDNSDKAHTEVRHSQASRQQAPHRVKRATCHYYRCDAAGCASRPELDGEAGGAAGCTLQFMVRACMRGLETTAAAN